MTQVEVLSWDTLENLRAALRRFQTGGDRAVERLLRASRDAAHMLEERCTQRRDEVHDLRDELETCDKEDDSDLRGRLAQAESALEEAEYWSRRAATLTEEFLTKVGGFSRFITDATPAACAFLQDKFQALQVAGSFRIETPAAAPATFPTTAAWIPRTVPTAARPGPPDDPFGSPLPRGFVWIPLPQINLAHELREVSAPVDFKKVDYETMRRGLESLRDIVLPAIIANPGVDSDFFRRHDESHGLAYDRGTQVAFDAFFGSSDYIYLTRGRDDEHFEIQNGRHRIKIIQELGWPAIPAQVKDLRRP